MKNIYKNRSDRIVAKVMIVGKKCHEVMEGVIHSLRKGLSSCLY